MVLTNKLLGYILLSIVFITLPGIFIAHLIAHEGYYLNLNRQFLIKSFVYILFLSSLIYLACKEPKNAYTKLYIALAVTVPFFLMSDSIRNYYSNHPIFIENFNGVLIALLIGALGLHIFLKKRPLLGYIFLLNLILSIFQYLPYYIPFYNDVSNTITYLSLHDIEHPLLKFRNLVTLFLTASLLLFLIQLCFLSVKQIHKRPSTDILEKKILSGKSIFYKLIESILYYFWKIATEAYYYVTSFGNAFWNNFETQFKKSIESYLDGLLIVIIFSTPIIVSQIGIVVFEYLSNPSLMLFSGIIGSVILFYLIFPILIFIVANSEFEPINFYKIPISQKPGLIIFTPCTIFFGLGIAAIWSWKFYTGTPYFLMLFVLVFALGVIWGYVNLKKTKNLFSNNVNDGR